MSFNKRCSLYVRLISAGVWSATKLRFAPWWGESFYFTSIVRGIMKKSKISMIQSLLLILTLMVAALGVSSAVAAEKEMVKDPTTGQMILQPQYGGSIAEAWTADPPPTTDTWWGAQARNVVSFFLEKLGIGDWALDRDMFEFKAYYHPLDVIKPHLAESFEYAHLSRAWIDSDLREEMTGTR